MSAAAEPVKLFREAVLHSYSMIFFNLSPWFAGLVMALSFLDAVAGLAGLAAVVLANGLAIALRFPPALIRQGDLGFNALLVGLGLGAYYEFNAPLALLLAFAAVITLFITVVIMGVLSKYKLPFLSLPFVLGLWTVMLASRNFEALGVSQRGLYLLNELYAVGDNWLVDLYHYLDRLAIPAPVKTYFRSLSAILFQYNLVSGVVLSLALLLYSRIAFGLSWLGFFTAFLFYRFIGADLSQLHYSYIGFNFILSAIAIGGIFLVSSGWSWFWALLLTPLISILTSSLANLLAGFQLASYALPFNIAVLSFLYVLKWRSDPRRPDEVAFQTFSPEHNRYNYLSNRERFRHFRTLPVSLPVHGEWFVSQGPGGAVTHRGEWRHAWDFMLHDERGRPCPPQARHAEDYHGYGKPVIAPADGTIADLVDGVPDNAVGATNLEQNWGNSLVIDHGYGLYSQLSHLKPGSFRVRRGEHVHKGQLLALTGNSGRSPEPHLHFQFQTTSFVGARTYDYPIALYLARDEAQELRFHLFDYPREGQYVQNIQPHDLLKHAFAFVPGQRLCFDVEGQGRVCWECRTDTANQLFLQCLDSGARAFFHNNGYLLYFTRYEGRPGTLLHHFFLAHYTLVLSYRPSFQLTDRYPLHLAIGGPRRWLQDLLSPFAEFMRAIYRVRYDTVEGQPAAQQLRLQAGVSLRSGRRERPLGHYRTTLRDYRIEQFEVREKGRLLIARRAGPAVENQYP